MLLCWVHGHIVPLVLSKGCVGFGVGGAFVFAFPSLVDISAVSCLVFRSGLRMGCPGMPSADFAGLFLGM